MKIKLSILYMAFFCAFYSYASTDKYRLIINSDPSSSITIGWNEESGSNATVYYGTTDHGTNEANYPASKTADRTVDYRGMKNSFARITGLTPNTNYYFVIKDSNSKSQRFWFKTAPIDNSRLSFIVGGDSRNNRTPRQNANRLVSKLKPHAVFFGGDMTAGGSDSEWQEWFEDWQLTTAPDGRMFPIVAARGNHENDQMIYRFFDTPDDDSYYAITFGQNLVRTYTLNSEISVLGDQLTWLKKDLSDSNDLIWKMAQYHKPMRPHTSGKTEGNSHYGAWAQLFYEEGVRLVVDCDSHVSKTTWPIKPSSASGNDEGFIREDDRGTVYTGEGGWGAPLRGYDDAKSWTRNGGSFNQFKLVFIDENKIELRTIKITDNASSVSEVSNSNSFNLPSNLEVFKPSTGEVVVINKSATANEEVAATGTVEYTVTEGNDDAEERIETGAMDLTSSDLELGQDGSNPQIVGIRFNDIQIPKGAVISSAYIQFAVKGTTSEQDPTNVVIKGEKVANSLTFTSDLNNISLRPTTDNAAFWDGVPVWQNEDDAGEDQKTPDLKGIVQEIVNLDDWEPSNSMTFIITGVGSREAKSYERGDETSRQPAKLIINFESSCPEITDAAQSFNGGATVADLLPAEAVWYEAADATTALATDAVLVDGEDYFAGTADGSCQTRGMVTVTLEDDSNETPGVLTYEVSVGNDDAEERIETGAIDLTSSDLELGQDGSNPQIVGIRFNDIQIPKGAVISSAYIQFAVKGTTSERDPTNVVIKGEKVANSLTFTSDLNNISLRPTTENAAFWDGVPVWQNEDEAGDDQKTPDLKGIVQEIVNLDDWEPSNSMTFFITGEGSREAKSFERGDETSRQPAKLIIILESSCPEITNPSQSFTGGATVGNLLPADAVWYETADATTALSPDVVLVDGEDYFAGTADGSCQTRGMVTVTLQDCSPATSGALTYEVSVGNDDAEERIETGAMDLTSSDLELGQDGSNPQIVGIRFNDIQLPKGAVITSAFIQFTVKGTTSERDPTNVVIKGEKVANSLTFTSDLNNISLRPTTENATFWDGVPVWENIDDAGAGQKTPDLKGIVQEIVNLDDWEASNSMTFFITGEGSREAKSFEREGGPAKLIINYETESDCPVPSNRPEITDATQSFCEGEATVADLLPVDAVWYEAADSTTALAPDAVLVDGEDYFAGNADGSCQIRGMVTVTVANVEAPILEANGIYCEADNPTIADLEENIVGNGTIVWYNAATEGNILNASEVLENGVTYYAALISTDTGCESSQRLAVAANVKNCSVVIPEVFSPNGDGINDRFIISNINEEYPQYVIEIYNRWGKRVFRGSRNAPSWDGVASESALLGNGGLPVGVYFYILHYNDGQTKPTKGSLYLSR